MNTPHSHLHSSCTPGVSSSQGTWGDLDRTTMHGRKSASYSIFVPRYVIVAGLHFKLNTLYACTRINTHARARAHTHTYIKV